MFKLYNFLSFPLFTKKNSGALIGSKDADLTNVTGVKTQRTEDKYETSLKNKDNHALISKTSTGRNESQIFDSDLEDCDVYLEWYSEYSSTSYCKKYFSKYSNLFSRDSDTVLQNKIYVDNHLGTSLSTIYELFSISEPGSGSKHFHSHLLIKLFVNVHNKTKKKDILIERILVVREVPILDTDRTHIEFCLHSNDNSIIDENIEIADFVNRRCFDDASTKVITVSDGMKVRMIDPSIYCNCSLQQRHICGHIESMISELLKNHVPLFFDLLLEDSDNKKTDFQILNMGIKLFTRIEPNDCCIMQLHELKKEMQYLLAAYAKDNNFAPMTDLTDKIPFHILIYAIDPSTLCPGYQLHWKSRNTNRIKDSNKNFIIPTDIKHSHNSEIITQSLTASQHHSKSDVVAITTDNNKQNMTHQKQNLVNKRSNEHFNSNKSNNIDSRKEKKHSNRNKNNNKAIRHKHKNFVVRNNSGDRDDNSKRNDKINNIKSSSKNKNNDINNVKNDNNNNYNSKSISVNNNNNNNSANNINSDNNNKSATTETLSIKNIIPNNILNNTTNWSSHNETIATTRSLKNSPAATNTTTSTTSNTTTSTTLIIKQKVSIRQNRIVIIKNKKVAYKKRYYFNIDLQSANPIFKENLTLLHKLASKPIKLLGHCDINASDMSDNVIYCYIENFETFSPLYNALIPIYFRFNVREKSIGNIIKNKR